MLQISIPHGRLGVTNDNLADKRKCLSIGRGRRPRRPDKNRINRTKYDKIIR
jgi:hypothetical protein